MMIQHSHFLELSDTLLQLYLCYRAQGRASTNYSWNPASTYRTPTASVPILLRFSIWFRTPPRHPTRKSKSPPLWFLRELFVDYWTALESRVRRDDDCDRVYTGVMPHPLLDLQWADHNILQSRTGYRRDPHSRPDSLGWNSYCDHRSRDSHKEYPPALSGTCIGIFVTFKLASLQTGATKDIRDCYRYSASREI